jgi:hypothetical protein
MVESLVNEILVQNKEITQYGDKAKTFVNSREFILKNNNKLIVITPSRKNQKVKKLKT